MKWQATAVVGLVLIGAAAVRAKDEAPVPNAQQPGVVGRPIAPIGRPTYKVTVQTEPKFPKTERPPASEPVTDKGLSVTLQPEKKSFAGNGPLALEVELKNVSKKPFLLYRGATLGEGAKLVISNQKTAAQWEPGSPEIAERGGVVSLPPGKSVKYSLVVETQRVAVPFPLPRPIPRPLPLPGPQIQRKQREAEAQEGVKDQRRPAVIALVTGPAMPCGQGTCRAKLMLEFKGDPLGKYSTPLWTGKIATGTVDFEVGPPEPVQPPVIGPPIVGPFDKERAVAVAQAAAEAALNANYRPLDPVRPPHAGAWIAEPAKTAQVKEQRGGGWKVSWTDVPKGKGFTYNVTVFVGAGGGAQVLEIFTGYSPR